MNKLCICVPVYGRYAITKLVLKSLYKHSLRLKNQLDIQILVAGDDPYYQAFCATYGNMEYIQVRNEPLDRKFNILLDQGAKRADWVLWTNSDDFFAPDYFLKIMEAMDFGHKLCVNDHIYITSINNLVVKDIRLQTGFTGTGWLINKSLVLDSWRDEIDFNTIFYSECLDSTAIKRLQVLNNGAIFRLQTGLQPDVLDVKSSESLTPFHYYASWPIVPVAMLQKHFFAEDIQALRDLSKNANDL